MCDEACVVLAIHTRDDDKTISVHINVRSVLDVIIEKNNIWIEEKAK